MAVRTVGLVGAVAVALLGWSSSPLLIAGAFGAGLLPDGPSVPAVVLLRNVIIAVDPGHGGFDPGAREKGVDEAHINLAVALRLRDLLERAGAAVVMTRTEDVDYVDQDDRARYGSFVRADLAKRLNRVEESGAHLLVSLHCNHFSQPQWRGAQVFYDAHSEPSRILAEILQDELVRVTAETDRQVSGRLELLLLKNASIPAVIVELGFMSNPRELQLLQDGSYQQLLAMAVFLGLCRYTWLASSSPN